VLFAVCLIACIVGSVVSNNASALLLYPIVVDLSTTIDGAAIPPERWSYLQNNVETAQC
jgi:di/tricarboxylate transporter